VVDSEIPISPRERESPGSPGEQSLDKHPESSWQGENIFVMHSPRGEPGENSPDEEFFDISSQSSQDREDEELDGSCGSDEDISSDGSVEGMIARSQASEPAAFIPEIDKELMSMVEQGLRVPHGNGEAPRRPCLAEIRYMRKNMRGGSKLASMPHWSQKGCLEGTKRFIVDSKSATQPPCSWPVWVCIYTSQGGCNPPATETI